MRPFYRLFQYWLSPLPAVAGLGALALLWLVRDMPIQPLPAVRVDALSAFFIFALAGGWALAARPGLAGSRWWRALALAAVLIAGCVTTLTPVIASAYLLLALLTLPPHPRVEMPAAGLRRLGGALRQRVSAAPGLLAAACLLVGCGALALRGALRYDDRDAGAALDGFVFWFVLLAAAIASSNLASPPATPAMRRTAFVEQNIVRLAWLYPLARLYSLGPWNNGWSFATLLLGGGAALWAAASALAQPDQQTRQTRVLLSYLGLALAGLGLGTSAGIVAGCYGMLAYLVLVAGGPAHQAEQQTVPNTPISYRSGSVSRWLLSGAVPLSAPFVAAWMLVGAAQAGGVTLLAGAAWLVTLLNALTAALMIDHERTKPPRSLLVAASASALLGVGAPLVVQALIQPVVEQLQGGLTLYGDVGIWSWVGLETTDAAHRQITALPVIAIAGFMLVLSALVYLVARLRELPDDHAQPSGDDRAVETNAGDHPMHRLSALAAVLRDEVPWLGGPASPPTVEERRVDGK